MSEGYVYDETICCSAEWAAELVPKIMIATQQKMGDRNLDGMRPVLVHVIEFGKVTTRSKINASVETSTDTLSAMCTDSGHVQSGTKYHVPRCSQAMSTDSLKVICTDAASQ